MNLVQVLGVVDARAGLDDVISERSPDIVLRQILLSGYGSYVRQADFEDCLRKVFRREDRRVIHFEESASGLLH